MANHNVPTVRMKWDVILRDLEGKIFFRTYKVKLNFYELFGISDVLKIHSHVEVVNVYQNMSIVMQLFHVRMEVMSHHIFVVQRPINKVQRDILVAPQGSIDIVH